MQRWCEIWLVENSCSWAVDVVGGLSINNYDYNCSRLLLLCMDDTGTLDVDALQCTSMAQPRLAGSDCLRHNRPVSV